MRTILGSLPLLVCAGAMTLCIRMMANARTQRPNEPAGDSHASDGSAARHE